MSTVAGPSGGVLGLGREDFPRSLLEGHPDLLRQLVTTGHHPRAGHDRKRWESVEWEDYRACVGIPQRRGPWSVRLAEERAGEPTQWVAEASGLPWCPGWYSALFHDKRGLVMSDVPAEVAGCLPFLDRVKADGDEYGSTGVLVTGLGLGIVPRWLLHHTRVRRLDVVEIDADVIAMVARDPAAREDWAADPRLHIHHADALTWTARGNGCALHERCMEPPAWDAEWHDIFDTVSPSNLPVMHKLHRRYGRWTRWQMSWERPECEAMRRRGQTHQRPAFCFVSEDGGPCS
jgi:hypothetical protein